MLLWGIGIFPFLSPYFEMFIGFRGKSKVGCQNLEGTDCLRCKGSFHFSGRIGRVEKVLGWGAISLVPHECVSGSVTVLGRRVLSR